MLEVHRHLPGLHSMDASGSTAAPHVPHQLGPQLCWPLCRPDPAVLSSATQPSNGVETGLKGRACSVSVIHENPCSRWTSFDAAGKLLELLLQ